MRMNNIVSEGRFLPQSPPARPRQSLSPYHVRDRGPGCHPPAVSVSIEWIFLYSLQMNCFASVHRLLDRHALSYFSEYNFTIFVLETIQTFKNMALQCGIVGLPNVGKSTLFNCLSNAKAQAANFPFCTIEPNGESLPSRTNGWWNSPV